MTLTDLVVQTDIDLRPDPSRVISGFFLPGCEDVGGGHSRAAPVVQRVLALSDDDVDRTLADVEARFADRHLHLREMFSHHADMVMPRVDPDLELSTSRRLLLGAYFSHETSIEGAALCNPSAVLHPDQSGDGTRFVMSVRGIAEGHRSTIGFRTGSLADDGTVSIDAAGPYPRAARTSAGMHHRTAVHALLADLGDDLENAAFVLDDLPEHFDTIELEAGIERLRADGRTWRNVGTTVANLRRLAMSSYCASFPLERPLSERVLAPVAPAEHQGLEDARFVRFTEADGTVRSLATYTAFDGTNITQQLLETTDFATFEMSPMGGIAAQGKGLALFPRLVGGRYAALSRSDRETNAVSFSDDLHSWNERHTVQVPDRPWETLQLGNCGSPIETERGWLVLTHGVGPMRTYSVGAILLDLRDPRIVLGTLDEPLLTPTSAQRDGYVPNVIYTCGGFAHGDTLVLPYGVGDQRISVATMSVDRLLDAMTPVT